MKRIKPQLWIVVGSGALLGLAGGVPPVSATITPVAWYQLGEADLGAIAGNTGNATTIDSVAGNNLTRHGTPNYSASVSPLAMGSTLSMQFTQASASPNSDAYTSANPATTAVTDVGLEAWVKTTSFNNGWIVNNGHNLDGYGFAESGGSYIVNMPNAGSFVIAPVVLNQWIHLGFVRDSGGDRAYANGVLVSTSSLAPLTPGTVGPAAPSFMIGDNAAFSSGADTPFVGLIDQVRVFTFADGAFSPSDFLITVPEPSTILLLGGGGWLLWRRRIRCVA